MNAHSLGARFQVNVRELGAALKFSRFPHRCTRIDLSEGIRSLRTRRDDFISRASLLPFLSQSDQARVKSETETLRASVGVLGGVRPSGTAGVPLLGGGLVLDHRSVDGVILDPERDPKGRRSISCVSSAREGREGRERTKGRRHP